MVLLHYLVVPGLGDGNGSRPEVTAVRNEELTPAGCGDVTVAPPVPAGAAAPAGEAARAA